MIHTPRDLEPRLQDLLADRASFGLAPAEAEEMQLALGELLEDEFTDVDLAAAAVDLAMLAEAGDLDDLEPLPDSCRSGVLAAVDGEADTAPDVIATIGSEPSWLSWGGWAAAAAIAMVAGVTLLGPQTSPTPGMLQSTTLTAFEARDAFVAEATDIERGAWGDWDDPDIAGVTGEVVWSDDAQRGYMTFVGLPENDPSVEQYQLWIVDRRGLAEEDGRSARISGGVFDIASAERDPETGAVVLPISPAIYVQGAAAFALTIERPGGVAVSDMSRRVVIAATSG
ncbi:MAG: anti-sigma factor [Planctomycetota bacterium]